MSRIDQLYIQGVRSFDNQHAMRIQFYAPLTLIVGLNGSGKTTIIECLKYATTGELPPNCSRGGAFIHDPKLCGEKEVLAQVKVSFKSTEGAKMVCTRSLQLTVKKASRTMKTLDGSILLMRDGQRQTISSRVVEMDTMMPRFLGVSKAILESVIFCHQEDSLWPLSEPSALKKRFDEIFDAMKYTKAIENIKILQKNKKTELGQFRIHEEHAKKDNDRAKRVKEDMGKLQDDCDGLRTHVEDLGQKLRDASRKAEEAWNKANEAGQIVGQLTGKRIERRTKEESVQSLRQNLAEMSETDDDLQQMLEKYEERVAKYESDLDSQKTLYQELGTNMQQTRNRLGAKEREFGSFEAQKDTYDRQIQTREKLIKETARSHGIRGFDLDLDDEQVLAFMDRISKMAREQNAAFDKARSQTQEELQRAQKVLNQINERKTGYNQRKEYARQSIATNDQKISNLQNEMNDTRVDEGSKVAIDSHLRDTKTRLDSAKTEFEQAKWDNQIETEDAELRKLEDRKEKLDAELVEGTRRAGDSARFDYMQKELKDRQRSLETVQAAHGRNLSSVVGENWTPANIENEFQRAIDNSSSQIAEAERQRDGTIREIEQLDYKLTSSRADIKAKQVALNAAVKAIRNAVDCEPQEYPEEIEKLESSRDFLKADTDSLNMISEYFESCLKVAKEHKACKTCMRGMKEKEVDVLVKNIEKERQKLKGVADEETLKQTEEDLKSAKAVSSDYETWERFTKETPQLQAEEAKLAEKRETLVRQLEQQDSLVSEKKTAKRDVDALSRSVQSIVKYNQDISSFETQIRELSSKQQATGSSRGLEAVQDDTKKINDEMRTVKARLSKATGDRDRARSTINSLELEFRDIQSKLSAAEHQLKTQRSLENQSNEYKALNSEQRDNIKSIDADLENLVPELSAAQAQYDDIARRGADKDRELQAETNKLNGSVNQLKMADQEIRAYHERGGKEQLERARREVNSLQSEISKLEQEQASTVRETKTLEDQLRNHSETKRSIADNQRYRRDLHQLQAVNAEIEELEQHNAEEDKERWEREGSQFQLQRNKWAAEQATLVGQLKSKDDQLDAYLKDWNSEYKNAAKNYRQAHVNVEVTKACIEDLGRYGGALDKAIMKYHSLKMEEINRIIEELWRKTYQGTDVDTILIRSETENVKSNKSYNYRVCMVKQDAEMDMRGRCSAGQKVLASIIIRLALAECFGVNCGLIALDEPTTNLDRDNIRALAVSLAEIIRARRQQRNFQLIVITHDEDFLRMMGCGDFTDCYYRVSRDEKQKSVIKKKNISEVSFGASVIHAKFWHLLTFSK